MTDLATCAKSFYDHTHPDTEYFPLSAHCTTPEPAVDGIRTDPANVQAQEEHGPPGSG